MKTKLTTLFLCTVALYASAQNPLKKGIISRGFYIHVGVAFPSGKPEAVAGGAASTGDIESENKDGSVRFGTQLNLEIGNQFYFFKVPTDKFGIGLRATWFQIGYSTYSEQFTYSSNGAKAFSLENRLIDTKLLKLGPQASFALADNMAIDATVMLSPSIYIGGSTVKDEPGDATAFDGGGGTFGAAFLIEPGLRFRYRKLAVGLDYGFGNAGLIQAKVAGGTSGGSGVPSGSGTVEMVAGKYNMSVFRLYAGFKF